MNISEFKKKLQAKDKIIRGKKILIACSGGSDSVALAHLLLQLRKEMKLKIGIAHFNHGLRGLAATLDAKFVRRFAEKRQCPFFYGAANKKIWLHGQGSSTEETARRLRYDFLCKTASRHGFSAVLTAHTSNDQAETVLMRMIQGTGLRGLCGIRPVMRMGETTFFRPFIDFSKSQILGFIEKEKLSFREDQSNESTRFLRNKIRKKILPLLARELNPRVIEALARIPAIVNIEIEALDFIEKKAWKGVFLKLKNQLLTLRRKALLSMPEALQFRVLDRGMKRIDPSSGLDFQAWQGLRSCLARGQGRQSLPRDIDFYLTPKKAILYKKFSPVAPK